MTWDLYTCQAHTPALELHIYPHQCIRVLLFSPVAIDTYVFSILLFPSSQKTTQEPKKPPIALFLILIQSSLANTFNNILYCDILMELYSPPETWNYSHWALQLMTHVEGKFACCQYIMDNSVVAGDFLMKGGVWEKEHSSHQSGAAGYHSYAHYHLCILCMCTYGTEAYIHLLGKRTDRGL